MTRKKLTDKEREERARMQVIVSENNIPEVGEFIMVHGEAREIESIETRPGLQRARAKFYLKETKKSHRTFFYFYSLVQVGAYFCQPTAAFASESPRRDFDINVAVHRSDPAAKTDSYEIITPNFRASWSGDKEMCLDVWAYLWKKHGAKLIAGMTTEELVQMRVRLAECDGALKADGTLTRAAMHLTGTRSSVPVAANGCEFCHGPTARSGGETVCVEMCAGFRSALADDINADLPRTDL